MIKNMGEERKEMEEEKHHCESKRREEKRKEEKNKMRKRREGRSSPLVLGERNILGLVGFQRNQ